jgi:hypothetical protein
MPNGCKIHRSSGHKIYQHLPLQEPPKFAQIAIYWFENIPSGNPGTGTRMIALIQQKNTS